MVGFMGEVTDRRRAPAASEPALVDDIRSAITFSRMHPSDCGQRQVFARLDGAQRVTLLYGESVTLDVLPGRHHVRVHNTLFWKNVEFSIEPGERLELIIINGARWWTAGVAGLLGCAPLFLTVKLVSVQ
jgi:hypothetical protein